MPHHIFNMFNLLSFKIYIFQVYIKDISSKKLTSPVGGSQVALKTIGTTTIRQAQPKPKIVTQTTNNSTVSSDFLSSIIQAVGIHVRFLNFTISSYPIIHPFFFVYRMLMTVPNCRKCRSSFSNNPSSSTRSRSMDKRCEIKSIIKSNRPDKRLVCNPVKPFHQIIGEIFLEMYLRF